MIDLKLEKDNDLNTLFIIKDEQWSFLLISKVNKCPFNCEK